MTRPNRRSFIFGFGNEVGKLSISAFYDNVRKKMARWTHDRRPAPESAEHLTRTVFPADVGAIVGAMMRRFAS